MGFGPTLKIRTNPPPTTRSLLIDGLTNSTQDEIFSLHPFFTGQQMMFTMAFLSLTITLPLIVLPPSVPSQILHVISQFIPFPLPAPATPAASAFHSMSPLSQSLIFIQTHPSCILPLLQFALLGGLGQLFIFETISHFGSLTLVMLTVTRKLFTMLLSVVLFEHKLTSGQWAGVAVVFGGIGLEAAMKRKGEPVPIHVDKGLER
jgi:UDP-galactose transporter B1